MADGDSMTVTGVSTVAGICTGGLPTSAVNATLSLKVPTISDSEKSGLFAPLPDAIFQMLIYLVQIISIKTTYR